MRCSIHFSAGSLTNPPTRWAYGSAALIPDRSNSASTCSAIRRPISNPVVLSIALRRAAMLASEPASVLLRIPLILARGYAPAGLFVGRRSSERLVAQGFAGHHPTLTVLRACLALRVVARLAVTTTKRAGCGECSGLCAHRPRTRERGPVAVRREHLSRGVPPRRPSGESSGQRWEQAPQHGSVES